MKNKILYTLLVVVIVTGAVYSYKRLDFGGKTTIFFKIAFGDRDIMRMLPKKPPPSDSSEFRSPEGAKEDRVMRGGRGDQGPPKARGRGGKPGMGKIIYLGNVIPYAFILSFCILITRVFDAAIRKIIKKT